MFREMYKSGIRQICRSQEERRQALLEKQKEDRQNLQDDCRSLQERLPVATENAGKLKSKIRKDFRQDKLAKIFCDTYGTELALQESEWLREVPANLCDWLLVPCPRGQRCMVVAYNRHTKCYNNLGKCVCIFRSMLPGDGTEIGSLSILDCIYVREENLFYVLDVIAFGATQNILYCEAEFRFFWLRSKWAELNYLECRSSNNQKPFHLLKQYDFENMCAIAEAFHRYPLWPNNRPELDGFLFYHRFAHYTCGTTPLVGWLFAYMVPDVLNMDVNAEYVKPKDYIDALAYMDLFDERLKAKRRRNLEHKIRLDQRLNNGVDDYSEDVESSNIDSLLVEHPEETGFLMCDDTKSDSGDETSLKKVLETQRELEMLCFLNGKGEEDINNSD